MFKHNPTDLTQAAHMFSIKCILKYFQELELSLGLNTRRNAYAFGTRREPECFKPIKRKSTVLCVGLGAGKPILKLVFPIAERSGCMVA